MLGNIFRVVMQWNSCPGSGGVTIPGGVQEPWRCALRDVDGLHGGVGWGWAWGSERSFPALKMLWFYDSMIKRSRLLSEIATWSTSCWHHNAPLSGIDRPSITASASCLAPTCWTLSTWRLRCAVWAFDSLNWPWLFLEILHCPFLTLTAVRSWAVLCYWKSFWQCMFGWKVHSWRNRLYCKGHEVFFIVKTWSNFYKNSGISSIDSGGVNLSSTLPWPPLACLCSATSFLPKQTFQSTWELLHILKWESSWS